MVIVHSCIVCVGMYGDLFFFFGYVNSALFVSHFWAGT